MYRKIVWYLQGRKTYTKFGFEMASRSFNPTDLDVDMHGRSVMVTGSNSGVGYAVAEAVAARGATVHMVCRNAARAEEAKQKIVEATKNEDIHVHVVDMANTDAVATFAKDFVASSQPLHVLINNAGCMIHEKKLTVHGLEYNFAVNTFATFVLTRLLLPVLSTGSSPRVITTSSGGMLLEKLEPDDFNLDKRTFAGDKTYSVNKRQQVVMMRRWAEQCPKVALYSMHPGWSDTPAVQEALPEFYEKMKDDLRTPAQGADTLTWLAVANNIPKTYNGKFLEDRKPTSEHLPLAWTKSSDDEEMRFMANLEARGKMIGLW